MIALEILFLLLENVSDDSVEVAVALLKECGLYLSEVSPKGLNSVFDRLRDILHQGQIEKRTQYMIEVIFAVRKDGFKDFPTVPEGLDLVDEADQTTHLLSLDDTIDPETKLDVFKLDPNFQESEDKYNEIKVPPICALLQFCWGDTCA